MIRSNDVDPVTGKKYYEICDACNYDMHRCYFCGEPLSHDGWDFEGNLHDVAFCRPDLVEHEPGPLCTRPATGDLELDASLGRPDCYWDHERGELKPA